MQAIDIMKEAVIISENATLEEAMTALIHQQTNTLLVRNITGELVGEVSVSDLFDAIIPEDLTGDDVQHYFSTESNSNMPSYWPPLSLCRRLCPLTTQL